MYWYGNGNGITGGPTSKPIHPAKSIEKDLSPLPGLSSSTTAYERFQDNSTDSEKDSLGKSDVEDVTSNLSTTSDVAK